ncbi:hypothetical protein BGZ83_006109 [Gryganskiella cystojenkinii]|nr:hypothetical protein BGZ83_006109 [Gryganskiella cystojenkinii]
MEVDGPKDENNAALSSPASGTAATMIAETMTHGTAETNNKRLKLTKEADRVGSDYSPSTDLPDPSQETKGLAEWVGQMGQMDHDVGEATKVTTPPQTETIVTATGTTTTTTDNIPDSDSDMAAAVTTSGSELASHNVDLSEQKSSSGDTVGQHLVQALLAAEPVHTIAEMNDSILAVASLSEPMVTALETMEALDSGNKEPQPITKDEPALEPVVQDKALITSSESQVNGAVESVQSILDEDHTPEATASKETVDPTVANVPATTSSPEKSLLHLDESSVTEAIASESTTSATLTPTQGHVAETSSELKDTDITSIKQSDSQAKDVQEPAQMQQSFSTPHPATASPPSVPTSLPSISDVTTGDSSDKGVHSESEDRTTPAAPNVPAAKEADVHNVAPRTTLPSLTTVTAPSPSLTSSSSQATPRKTMSLSALLIDNDDETGVDQDVDLRMGNSSNVFDRFSHTARSPPSPPRVPVPRSPPVHAPPAHAAPSPHSLQSSSPVQTAYRPTASHGSAHYNRDAYDHPPQDSHQAHQHHPPSYGRTYTESLPSSNHGQEHVSQATNRNGSAKDYPADEVMDSGYTPPRHRLASPLGMRTMPDPIHGPPNSTKDRLPGVGSVSNPVVHHRHEPGPPRQEHHIHGRQDGAGHPHPHPHPHPHSHAHSHALPHAPPHAHHHPVSTGPISFGAAHHNNTNGALSYPGAGPMGGPTTHSSAAPLSSTNGPERRTPRLIVKNDASLRMEGRPEHFLGYYRYDPTQLLPAMQGRENSLLEVRIASSYLTYDNIKVQKRELWGTDVYTDDSDIVAMLIHSGLFIPPVEPLIPESDILDSTTVNQQHNFVSNPIKHKCPTYDVAVILRVLPTLVRYQGSIRNRIKSRTWNTKHDGVSFRIESIRKLTIGEALNRGRSQSKRRIKESDVERQRVLANVQDDSTESLQNERAMRTATFEFTRQGDPCFKYTPELVMDRDDGMSHKWTSWRFKKEVLILENDEERYEISLQHQAGTGSRVFDQYRFAVISPRTSLSSRSKAGYPLDSSDLVEVLYEDLDWQDFEWVERGVVVQPTTRSKSTRQTRVELHQQDSAMEDVQFRGAQENDAALERNKNSLAEELETQQDGVFCVVSRLFWRSRSEKDSTRSIVPQNTDRSSSVVPLKETSRPPSAAAVSIHQSVAHVPVESAMTVSDTTALTATPQKAQQHHPSDTASSAKESLTGLAHSTLVPETTTAVRPSTGMPQPAGVQWPLPPLSEPKELTPSATPIAVDDGLEHVSEKEEGELEEGEIPSD